MQRLIWSLFVVAALVTATISIPNQFLAIYMVMATQGSHWYGTAFAISPHHVATAGHVVVVSLPDQSNPVPPVGTPVPIKNIATGKMVWARVTTFRDNLDFCLLYTATKLPHYLPVTSTLPPAGTPLTTLALAIGSGRPDQPPFPVLFQSHVANPQVVIKWSATGVVTGDDPYEVAAIYTDKSGMPGFSGSPVLNPEGAVVGIHVGSLRAVGIVIPAASWYPPIKQVVERRLRDEQG